MRTNFSSSLFSCLGLVAALFATSTYVSAQTQLIKSLSGPSGSEHYGYALHVGDLNGDGVKDLAIGDWYHSATHVGRIEVRSGANLNSTLLVKTGSASWQQFGAAVGIIRKTAVICGKLLVGSPQTKVNNIQVGSVHVYDGCSGQLLNTVNGTEASGRFGSTIAVLGDVNSDGFDDYAVGSPTANSNGGRVRIYSGAQPSTALLTLSGGPSALFGMRIASGPDINNDGANDLLVGQPNYNGKGRVWIYDSRNGALINSVTGALSGGGFGFSVGTLSGTVGQSRKLIIVGAPYALDGAGVQRGRAAIYSFRNNGLVKELHSQVFGTTLNGQPDVTSLFGTQVGNAGDFNNDGHDDIGVSAPWSDPNGLASAGMITVFNGIDGSVLTQITGSVAGQYEGEATAGSFAQVSGGFVALPRVVGSNYLVTAAFLKNLVRVFEMP